MFPFWKLVAVLLRYDSLALVYAQAEHIQASYHLGAQSHPTSDFSEIVPAIRQEPSNGDTCTAAIPGW